MSALDWARRGMPDALDWKGAIEAYDYTALSRTRAYEAVGHVLHLLQDMAQPDHAGCRPHPGNYIQDKIKDFGLDAALCPSMNEYLQSHVGYERLWKLLQESSGAFDARAAAARGAADAAGAGAAGTPGRFAGEPPWPPGVEVRVPASLKDAFDLVAFVSQKAEKDLGLPSALKNEIALGLGALKISNVLLGVDHLEMTRGPIPIFGVRLQSLHTAIRTAGWLAFNDNLWSEYTKKQGVLPTIPWPSGDAHTEKHLELGRKMLRLAEEHGAGLLRHFHDIVNPPPFVQSVEILQEGKSRYRADWLDGDPDRNGHVAARTVNRRRKEALAPGKEAEVWIRFGPFLRHEGAVLHEAVGGVSVSVIPDAGGDPLPVGVVGMVPDPESAGAYMCRATFVPTVGGRLRIVAEDLDAHYTRRDRAGESLDSNPATPARATWGTDADGAPYPWEGYEPGFDELHDFAVVGEVRACKEGKLPHMQLELMRWSEWSGTIAISIESKNVVVSLAGNWDEWEKTEVQISAAFRGMSWDELDKDGDQVQFGRGAGSASARGDTGFVFFDGTKEVKHHEEAWQVQGYGGLSLEPDEDGKHGYEIQVNEPEGQESPFYVGAVCKGNACSDGRLMGSHKFQSGDPDGRIFMRRVTNWSFTSSPAAVPSFVAILRAAPYRHIDHKSVSSYLGRIADVLRPAIDALEAAEGYEEARKLQSSEDESDREVWAYWKDKVFPSLEKLGPDIDYGGHLAAEAWLHATAETESEYEAKVTALQESVRALNSLKRSAEEYCAAATNRHAARVEPLDPAAAERIRSVAKRLKDKGLEDFSR